MSFAVTNTGATCINVRTRSFVPLFKKRKGDAVRFVLRISKHDMLTRIHVCQAYGALLLAHGNMKCETSPLDNAEVITGFFVAHFVVQWDHERGREPEWQCRQ